MNIKEFTHFNSLTKGLKGDVAEVGVYQGNSAEELLMFFPGRKIHLFDTFTGIPDQLTEFDGTYKVGDHNETSYEKVKERFNGFFNIYIYPGIFPRSALSLNNKSFVFVNIDVDIYQSTKDCWEFFYPKLVKGGVFYIQDDYGSSGTPGVTKATDEFLTDKPEKLVQLHEGTGGPTYIIKQ